MATSAKTTPPCRWLSLAHWRLMLAPARLDIVEVMRSLGPSSIKEVAAAVGRPATSLYPHFKLLMRIGVVVEEAPRRLAKHVERVFRLAADDFVPDFNGEDRKAVNKAALVTARGIFNSAQHAFRRAAKAQVLQAGGGTLNHGLVHELLWLSPG
jgi:predicted transcriptional regulator